MIGLKINGYFLKLKAGTSAEITRKSPFFAINEVTAEYTNTPVSLVYDEETAVALGFLFQFYTFREKKKFSAELYDGNTFKSRCVLVVESARLNVNRSEGGELNGYLLFGVSEFFSDVKGKLLKDLRLGGARTFDFTTNNPTDGSNGFWQHIHDTWTDDSIPYVFAPVRNELWSGFEGVDWMNGLANDGKINYDLVGNPLVPLIRVKYVLEQIFGEFGWKIDFSGLNDTDWEKLVLVSTKEIEWYTTGFTYDPITGTAPTYTPKTTITIRLNQHVPQQKTISDFIVQLFNRYGWAPVFDRATRNCRLIASKELRNGQRVDWTAYTNPTMDSAFSDDPKIFAFENDIDSNDELPSAPDFTGKKFGVPVATKRSLATPTADKEGLVVYCVFENQWVIAALNEDTNEYEWQLYADNIYNEEPEGATDTISTSISTLPVYLTLYRVESAVNYYGFFPYMKESRFKEFGFRTLLYHGMVPELTADGSTGLITYPYASSILFDSVGNQATEWSNVFNHPISTGPSASVNKGITDYWLKTLTDIIKYGEEVQPVVYLPLHVLLSYTWEQVVMIANIPHLVESFIEPIPYTGFIQATMKRLVDASRQPDAVVVTPVVPFFAHLAIVNIHDDYGGVGPYGGWTNYKSCDILVTLFLDAAGTIPYTPPGVGVNVLESGTHLIDGVPIGPPGLVWVNITEASQYIGTRSFYSGTSGGDWTIEEHLEDDPNGVYTVI